MVTRKNIEDFLRNKEVAVIGASSNKKKFGNIIMHALLKKGYAVFPVNPGASEIDGIKCYPDTVSLPSSVKAAVFITQPNVTLAMIRNICDERNISNVWFQQGSEDPEATLIAKRNTLNIIYGECILMYIKPSGFPHNIHLFFRKTFGRQLK